MPERPSSTLNYQRPSGPRRKRRLYVATGLMIAMIGGMIWTLSSNSGGTIVIKPLAPLPATTRPEQFYGKLFKGAKVTEIRVTTMPVEEVIGKRPDLRDDKWSQREMRATLPSTRPTAATSAPVERQMQNLKP